MLSPRLLWLVPVAGALVFVGRSQFRTSDAQNSRAPANPLAALPDAPTSGAPLLPAPPTRSGTLGGPIGNPAPPRLPAKPAPTSRVAAIPVPTPMPISPNAVRVGLSTAGGPLQLWFPGGAILRDETQPARAEIVSPNSSVLFVMGAPKSQKIGATTFRGPITVQAEAQTLRGWNRIQVSPLGKEFARATSNGKSPRFGRPYRGAFEVFPQLSPEPNHRKGALALVNVVGLEDYLKGVVPWEMSPAAPAEALKAQAICARTKTLDFKTSRRYTSGGFDVCDYDACQGYPGVENEKPATTEAVEQTTGLALFYGGRPIDAVYSTNSGGVTAAARDVWRGDVPYLQSVRDFPAWSPLESLFGGAMSEGKWAQFVASPFPSFARPDGLTSSRYEARKYRWSQFVSVEEASRAFAAQGISRVLNIEVEERASSGRARRVKVVGVDAEREKEMLKAPIEKGVKPKDEKTPRDLDNEEFSPVDYSSEITPTKTVVLESDGPIRAMFSKRLGSTTALPSSLFVISPLRGADGTLAGWTFAGAGWGHGVGMCQRGAQNHAKAGWDARRILAWYYRGVELRAVS